MTNRHSVPTATFFLLILVLGFSSLPGEPYRTVLTSVRDGVHIDSWRVTSRERGLESGVGFSVEKLTLHGGKQEGVDLIVIDNGKLRIRVIPTRGMGVLDVKTKDTRLGWDSPVREVVHPRHVNLHDRGGWGGWRDSMSGWRAAVWNSPAIRERTPSSTIWAKPRRWISLSTARSPTFPPPKWKS